MKIRRITQAPVRAPGRISTASVTLIDGPPYEGETEVTPTTDVQTLPTKNTLVKKDITVEAIPYYTTTNPSGGYTAIIGG